MTKPAKLRPRSLRQTVQAIVRYGGSPSFVDFAEQLAHDHVRVRVDLHGAADVYGVIVWMASSSDVFVVEQDKGGLKLIRNAAVISISQAPKVAP